jgi:hypothetical protein
MTECCNALIALQNAYLGINVNDIVDSVLGSYGRAVSEPARDKLLNYVRLLASTGKSEDQLLTLGSAYLREMLEPDRRYSGC